MPLKDTEGIEAECTNHSAIISLKILFSFTSICVSMHVSVVICRWVLLCGCKKGELSELQTVVGHPMWVVGLKPGSAVRGASAPNHWIISLAPPSGFVNIKSRVRDQTKK